MYIFAHEALSTMPGVDAEATPKGKHDVQACGHPRADADYPSFSQVTSLDCTTVHAT